MTCNKKGPCSEEKGKTVEKLTDESLDKVSGGKVGCQPSWPPCAPKEKVGCPPTATPCQPKHGVGCLPTATPKGKAGADFCGPFPSPQG